MTSAHRTWAIALVALAALAGGCGGGGSSTTVAGGGTGGTGNGGNNNGPVSVSVGAMTVGSIILNSIRYADGSANVVRDGRVAAVSELRNGMVVKLRGTLNDDGLTGTASEVKVENEVRGFVQSVSAGSSPATFAVLNQTVIVDDLTVFANVSGIGGLSQGASVEVHGQREADGRIRASRVEVLGGASTEDVRGAVAALNTGTSSFAIGTLPVDFAAATFIPAGATAGALANGVIVEVRGAFTAGRFVANTITFEDSADASTFAPSGEYKLSVEGHVTGFTAHPGSFRVNNQVVTTASSTRFEWGTALDLVNNARLEAEGPVASGVIQANKISFRRTRTIVTSGITDRNAGACTLTVLGKTVRLIDSTEVRAGSGGGASIGCGAIGSLSNGQRVEARGFIDTAGVVIAERIDTNPSGGSGDILQALVSAKDDGARTLTLFGIQVNLATTPGSQLKDINDVAFGTPAAFFAAVTPNATFVKAKGSFSGGVLTASEAEVEN